MVFVGINIGAITVKVVILRGADVHAAASVLIRAALWKSSKTC